MRTEFIHMERTAKVEIIETFRYELIQFVLLISRTIEIYIHNRGDQCELVNYSQFLPIYSQMCDIMYSSPTPGHVYSRAFLVV